MKKSEQGTKKRGLQKDLRPIDVWGLALGAIIGWGCFVLPGNAFLPKAGPLGTAIGMGLGALMLIVISYSYGFLIKKYPSSGGEFVYIDSSFGKTHAFVGGWFLVLTYWSLIPLNATAIALIARFLFPGIIEFGLLYEIEGFQVYTGEVIVASLFLMAVAWVNIRGIKSAGWVQTAVAMTLIAGILLVTIGTLLSNPTWSNLMPLKPVGDNWWHAIFAIVAMSPWAYLGFDCIPQAAEEYNFPHKKSRKLMITAILFACVLYVAINTVTALALPWNDIVSNPSINWPTGFAVHKFLGNTGLVLLGIAMFCAVISGMNAFYISASRLMYAMAHSRALPKAFGRLHPKYNTPVNAILFMLALSLIAPWFGREVLLWIVDMTSFGASIVFAYSCASALHHAYKDGDTFHVIMGALGVLISFFFVSLLIVPGMPGFLAAPSLISLAVWALLGLVFYLIIRPNYIHKHGHKRVHDMVKNK